MSKANRTSRLGRWLTENDVTYQELAERLGVTEPAIHHYIARRNQPSAETLVRLSEITKIPPRELLDSFEQEPVV